jgi:hypothetical protein
LRKVTEECPQALKRTAEKSIVSEVKLRAPKRPTFFANHLKDRRKAGARGPPFAERRDGWGTRKCKGKCQSEERFLASLGMTIGGARAAARPEIRRQMPERGEIPRFARNDILGGQLIRTCTFEQAANRLAKCYRRSVRSLQITIYKGSGMEKRRQWLRQPSSRTILANRLAGPPPCLSPADLQFSNRNLPLLESGLSH